MLCCFHSGWILIDRSGKHFGSILCYLRDSTVVLPKGRQAVQELLAEAKYYLIQGLVELCQNTLQVSHIHTDLIWSDEKIGCVIVWSLFWTVCVLADGLWWWVIFINISCKWLKPSPNSKKKTPAVFTITFDIYFYLSGLTSGVVYFHQCLLSPSEL